MKAAVTQARAGNYAASLAHLDKVVSGGDADALARGLVGEWTRLSPESRASTNILVLENATRLVVNAAVRDTLMREGVIAAEGTRLQVLVPAGMSDQEKHYAHFYKPGQVVTFARDMVEIGISRDAEYRVLGSGREANGRQMVRLADEHDRVVRWDPRLERASHVNVFNQEERALAAGDRIQWRLINRTLGLKNAERGTVEKLDGTIATIRWDRDERVRSIDLEKHRTWDHGYAETVYSAQSKTYARAHVLAPIDSALVNGQNYYTAITRARFGVKLWTEDADRLADTLATNSGEKTSALEGLGRIKHASLNNLNATREIHTNRAGVRLYQMSRREQLLFRQYYTSEPSRAQDLVASVVKRAKSVGELLERLITSHTQATENMPGGRDSHIASDLQSDR